MDEFFLYLISIFLPSYERCYNTDRSVYYQFLSLCNTFSRIGNRNLEESKRLTSIVKYLRNHKYEKKIRLYCNWRLFTIVFYCRLVDMLQSYTWLVPLLVVQEFDSKKRRNKDGKNTYHRDLSRMLNTVRIV